MTIKQLLHGYIAKKSNNHAMLNYKVLA